LIQARTDRLHSLEAKPYNYRYTIIIKPSVQSRRLWGASLQFSDISKKILKK
jgi:hypothetical protein